MPARFYSNSKRLNALSKKWEPTISVSNKLKSATPAVVLPAFGGMLEGSQSSSDLSHPEMSISGTICIDTIEMSDQELALVYASDSILDELEHSPGSETAAQFIAMNLDPLWRRISRSL